MRKLSRREQGLLSALALALVAVAAWAFLHSGAAPAVLGRAAADRPLPAVPRIDLARLDAARGEDSAGRRDLFTFGREREPEENLAPPPVAPPVAPPPTSSVEGPGGASGLPASPTLPPLKLYYIGSVESRAGIKVAVLVTDRREVLTGQSGQVVANRYRIARIGLESVDLEDVGSGQSRRIPLKGN